MIQSNVWDEEGIDSHVSLPEQKHINPLKQSGYRLSGAALSWRAGLVSKMASLDILISVSSVCRCFNHDQALRSNKGRLLSRGGRWHLDKTLEVLMRSARRTLNKSLLAAEEHGELKEILNKYVHSVGAQSGSLLWLVTSKWSWEAMEAAWSLLYAVKNIG